MKSYIKILLAAGAFLMLSGLVSCRKYLDKAPDAGVSEKDVFVNFRNFEGFTEELYCCLPDMSKPTWNGEWNTGDDILSTTNANYRLNAEFDNGNYWAWRTGGGGWD
ncbi:MAG: RagB/SusD family nutrient uptake outer membrane protein, partial [Candidatus Dadabacteria bacterium]